ncbi:hypothetical protein B4Q04_20190 [Zobellia sp. OII3]|uniref:malectin domain-containing carbohydrate-binding protein n=1 Tax=Zobellia sp. OII3 TaxID=2034520 RepID=UPI000B5388D6|nr:malectin domain-containing carbohydrate-binding protein [Zobellia sp. OII3]OWW23521.1 hypothetical protein B4Q04_20190 [Zobellia sp. OII3]
MNLSKTTLPFLTVLICSLQAFAQTDYVKRINCGLSTEVSGGPATIGADEFIAEGVSTGFTRNGGRTHNGTGSFTLGEPFKSMRLTDDPSLMYNFDVDAGTYDITIYFAEPHHGVNNTNYYERVFDVSVNGVLELDNLNIMTAASDDPNDPSTVSTGANKVYEWNGRVTTTSDTEDITLLFEAVSNDPIISAIAIVGVDNSSGNGGPGGQWSKSGSNLSYTQGNVGIGTSAITGYKLAVDGPVRAREVRVDADNWPDYVFQKEYTLPTLEEVKRHIEEKGHLPNIPSAKEIESNGLEVGEMNRLLLEKIEELTLYIIKQSENQNQLESRIENLENQD